MNQAAPQLYTAAQLARMARVSKRTLLADLTARGIAARDRVTVRGNRADAWALDDLPENRRAQIETAIEAHGAESAQHLVKAAPVIWQPKNSATGRMIPLAEIHPSVIRKAEKTRDALRPSLSRRLDAQISSTQLEALGIEDYRMALGHAISARGFRALLARIVERDNFAENWNRLEIYIDDNPKRIVTAAAVKAAGAGLAFRKLNDCMAGFHSVTDASHIERAALWETAVAWFNEQTDAGADAKRSRVKLIDFLFRAAPWLSASKNALRVAFQDKLAKKLAGKSLGDGRNAKKGIPTAPPYPQEEIELAIYHSAFNCGGRVSQAVRELRAGELGVETELVAELFNAQGEGQSRAPKIIKLDAAKSLSAPYPRETAPPRENNFSREIAPVEKEAIAL